jgi:hypothetical protein
MVLDGDELDQISTGEENEITRYYFTGTAENPKWEVGPNVNLTALLEGKEDIPFPNHMSVAYNSHLGLWVLIYGGSFDAFFKKIQNLFENNEEENFVYVRLAKNPWGPWSEKLVIYPKESDLVERCKVLHDPSASKELNCTTSQPIPGPFSGTFPAVCLSSCVESDTMTPVLPIYELNEIPGISSEDISGFEYGVSLWQGAHSKYETEDWMGSTFYFVMSTFNPYRVVLMRATVGWPKLRNFERSELQPTN